MAGLRVIYVAGIEHNGSTFLGIALGSHPQIQCVGELSQLPRLGWLGQNVYMCACGVGINVCPFWSKVRKEWINAVGDDIDVFLKFESAIDRNICLPRVITERFIRSPLFSRYCDYTRILFEVIEKVGGSSAIVDTSKRVSRALALSMVEGVELRLIHLVRDARGVAHSSSKPTRAIRRPYWQSALRWNLINLTIEQVRKIVGDDKSMVVRYEDYVSSPVRILTQVADFIGVDIVNVAEKVADGQVLSAGHLGIGNQLRLKDGVALRTNIDWPQRMARREQKRVWGLTKWFMRHYGYKS